MFNFLKKKLKQGIEKISKRIKKEPKEIKPVEEVPEKLGIIKKIKKRIVEKKIKEEDIKNVLYQLKISLLQSDVALAVAEKIVNDLRNNLVGKSVKRKEVEKIIRDSFKDSITEILNVDSFDLFEKIKTKQPYLILFLGFNGSGKTTTIAKLGNLINKNNLSCVFAAADTWRAASIEQIEEHGSKLGINVIKHKYKADPAAVIFDARKHAEANKIDVILADTAGRSHANVNLIEELKKIVRVNKPDVKLLVLDSLTGNDIVDQAKTFDEAVGVDAVILTKADVYDRGGAVLSVAKSIGKPILYLGVGQSYEDLEEFDANKIVENLLE